MLKDFQIFIGNNEDISVIKNLGLHPRIIKNASYFDSGPEAKEAAINQSPTRVSRIAGSKESYILLLGDDTSLQGYIDTHYACCKFQRLSDLAREQALDVVPVINQMNAGRFPKAAKNVYLYKQDEQYCLSGLSQDVHGLSHLFEIKNELQRKYSLSMRQLGLLLKTVIEGQQEMALELDSIESTLVLSEQKLAHAV